MLARSLLSALLIVAASAPAWARRPPPPPPPTLEELVGEADLVVVGTVLRVERLDFGPAGILSVQEALKGPLGPPLTLNFLGGRTQPGDVSRAVRGETGIFFLSLARDQGAGHVPTDKDWYVLAGAGRGRFPVRGRGPKATVQSPFGVKTAAELAAGSAGRRRGKASPAGSRTLEDYTRLIRAVAGGDPFAGFGSGDQVDLVKSIFSGLRDQPPGGPTRRSGGSSTSR